MQLTYHESLDKFHSNAISALRQLQIREHILRKIVRKYSIYFFLINKNKRK